jgi:phage terminase Nu1 subunit (DNA packaging protein)
MQAMMLSGYCTQQEFGNLVGISQPAVSDLITRSVLQPGHSTGQWLHWYCAHLREQAAGRGGDGELAANRAEESRVRKELLEIKLAERRREVAPVEIIEQVLAHVGSQIRGTLEPLHVTLKMRCPQLAADDIKIIETEVATACNLASTMCMASLTALDEEDGEGA